MENLQVPLRVPSKPIDRPVISHPDAQALHVPYSDRIGMICKCDRIHVRQLTCSSTHVGKMVQRSDRLSLRPTVGQCMATGQPRSAAHSKSINRFLPST